MLVRMYSGDDGQSHFEDLDFDMWPDHWSMTLANANINFGRRDPGYFNDLHNESRRQYLIVLSGQMDLTVGDGTTRVLKPGDILLAEDLTGEGHIVRNLGSKPFQCVTIPLDEQ